MTAAPLIPAGFQGKAPPRAEMEEPFPLPPDVPAEFVVPQGMTDEQARAMAPSLKSQSVTSNNQDEHRSDWKPRLLQEAIDAVTGDRNQHYGDPWVNHQNTADVWRWWIKCRFGVDVPLVHKDICEMNILQKASRLATDIDHWDGWKDQAGYAGNGGVCIDHESDDRPGK